MSKQDEVKKDGHFVEFIAHRREKDDADQSLLDHLIETSNLAGKYAGKVGLKKHGELLGLLHDLGKGTEEFYKYIGSATGKINPDEDDYVNTAGKKGKIDHSSAGAQIIYRYLSNKGKESLYVLQILPLVIASHHSGLIDCLSSSGDDNFIKRINKPDEKTRATEAFMNLDNTLKQKINEFLTDGDLIHGFNLKLKELQESIDSTETWVFKVGMLVRFLFSCLIDADRLSTADFEFPESAILRNRGNYVSWQVLIDKLENHLVELDNQARDDYRISEKVNVLRKVISNDCLQFSSREKGLYKLTVPTGGGKTFSSLRFALHHAKEHNMDRIIYVIPYTSIIDQNADKVRKVLEDGTIGSVVLEHHSNLTPEEETCKQKLLAENWDAPIVFTTMVQFLESLFGYGTRNARRIHQLANSVIIFDEIQTLPVRCVHLFNVAIRFFIKMCKSTVVLCTATQPLLDNKILGARALQIGIEQQMMPNVQKLFEELKRVEIYDKCKAGGWTNQEIAELAKDELIKTGSVLIIVNTKKAAISLYKLLKRLLEDYSNAKVYHLSTNMCPSHRMNKMKEITECLSSNKPIICVSTQLIEAGVDIDFGSVIRYLAGLDSIAQAAGRCNRNGARPHLGRVFIINPADENLDQLRDIKGGRDIARRVLYEYQLCPESFDGDIIGVKAMECYYKYYFFDRKEEMSYQVNCNSEVGRSDNLFNILSVNSLATQAYQRNYRSLPLILLRQSFMTAAKAFQAIDTATRGIIVPYGEEGSNIIKQLCGKVDLETQFRLLKEAQRYSVNIHFNQFKFIQLLEQKVIYEVREDAGIYYLDDQYYSDEFGMSEDKVNEMEFLYVKEE